MTVSDLIQRVEELSQQAQMMSDVRIINALNRGYQYMARSTYGLRDIWSKATLADDHKITLPRYILTLLTTTWEPAGGTPSVVSTKFWTDAASLFGSRELQEPQATSGTPRFLITYGNTKAVLYPKPTVIGTLKGTSAMIPSAEAGNPFPALSALIDEPKIPDDTHDSLAYHAAMEISATNPATLNLAQAFKAERDAFIRGIVNQQDDLPMEPVRLQPFLL